MSKYIEIPGVGLVEFPADVSSADIESAIQRYRSDPRGLEAPVGGKRVEYVTDPALLKELNAEFDSSTFVPVAEAEPDLFDTVEVLDEAAESRAAERAAEKNHQLFYHSTVMIALACIVGGLWWKRREFTTARLKAVYLIWSFVNLMVLISSPTPWGEDYFGERDYGSFYPFISSREIGGEQSGLFFDHLEQYDITEFAFYVLVPLVIWQALRLWKAGGNARL